MKLASLFDQIAMAHAESQREKLQVYKRRVPFGDLVTDRRNNALEYGFGEGTTMYDSVFVRDDVQVGRHCWIGPNCILDGTGGLIIGDHVCIDAGTHIYTHDSSKRFVTMGSLPDEKAPVTIGSGVFIGPQVVITMGVTIGNHVMIGAHSFVNADVPSCSVVFGQPAKVRRTIQLDDLR